MDREARTRTILFRLGDDGVIDCEAIAGAESTLDDAVANIRTIRSMIGEGERATLLVDLRGSKSVSREAREYYESEECQQVVALAALLVGSPLSRALGDFFMRLTKTTVQLKLFSSASEARTWLLTTR